MIDRNRLGARFVVRRVAGRCELRADNWASRQRPASTPTDCLSQVLTIIAALRLKAADSGSRRALSVASQDPSGAAPAKRVLQRRPRRVRSRRLVIVKSNEAKVGPVK